MEINFVKADSRNLPKVDSTMVEDFFRYNSDFNSPEVRNVKTTKAGRESYGDNAIGYVQLCRESGICTLKGKICPEHRVRSRPYNVVIKINKKDFEVISCQCLDCPAAAGGCKHAVAFLMWTHRRSEEPACTEIECYWNKPTLSKVGTSVNYVTLDQICKKTITQQQTNPEFLIEFLQEAKKRKIQNCELLHYQNDFKYDDVRQFSFHHMLFQACDEVKSNVNKFIKLFVEKLDAGALKLIEESTRNQCKSPLWYELRYGRITASKIYEVSKCKTSDGSLVAAIMGAKAPNTSAMKRGRKLESAVIKVIQSKLQKNVKPCGLFISKQYPMIAATPDGITSDSVIEVKCPSSEKNKCNYVKDGLVCKKYVAQVQLQMFTTNMKKGYFCIAHPDFEKSKKVDVIVIERDLEYIDKLLKTASLFWKSNIYHLLTRSST